MFVEIFFKHLQLLSPSLPSDRFGPTWQEEGRNKEGLKWLV